MGTKRKKIGKNHRLKLKAKKRREAAAAADAAAEASASKVFWPRAKNTTTTQEESAGSAYSSTRHSSQSTQFTSWQSANDDQGRELLIGMAKLRENRQPKYKVAQGYAEDHERRLKLIELHIESVADMFTENRLDITKNRLDIDGVSTDIRDLIDAFNEAVEEGKLIGQKVDLALAVLVRLAKRQTAASNNCTEQNEKIEAAQEDIKAAQEKINTAREDIEELFFSLAGASTSSKASSESMKTLFDEKVENLESKVDAELQKIREAFEERLAQQLEKSTTKTTGEPFTTAGEEREIKEDQGSWKGRLRSREQHPA
ncbi:hypothetical protein CkaCkLH20_04413 [Colletotrichum karsti]|uniref:Uncharacterized protein n=1 Tax=Colletotrichum karsti TaxID=1095194 RepID=A0A9P6I8S5_9PEZI|nr:uncharacterized protein CkaCkLH20_04413 [Colletotrichum karsti]KAF9877837.1 hypothetical protein CkaCkLH20_04413 [Colletotrichum karsti]